MQPTTPQPLNELAERTIRLADGRPGLRTALQITACSPLPPPPSEEQGRGAAAPADSQPSTLNSQPILDFIASSDTLDRYHEIIDAAGWRLDNYRRNPVFQNAHNYGDIIFTLGKAVLTEVREVGGRQVLFQRIQFATDINPMARIAYGLYRGGYLSAVSVGFIPLRWENGTPETNFRRKYLEQELLEVSAVGIPANPDALALGLKSGAVQKSDLQELLDLLHSVVGLPRRGSQGEGVGTDAAGLASWPYHKDPEQAAGSRLHRHAGSVPPQVQGTLAASWASPPYQIELLSLARALRDLLRRS